MMVGQKENHSSFIQQKNTYDSGPCKGQNSRRGTVAAMIKILPKKTVKKNIEI